MARGEQDGKDDTDHGLMLSSVRPMGQGHRMDWNVVPVASPLSAPALS